MKNNNSTPTPGMEAKQDQDMMAMLRKDIAEKTGMLANTPIMPEAVAIEKMMAEMLLQVADKSVEVNNALAMSKQAKRMVNSIIATEIVRVADGNLKVTEYQETAKSEQEVYCFVGAYWTKVPKQRFLDFVRDCAEKAGLPCDMLNNPTDMQPIVMQVQFRVARSPERRSTENHQLVNLLNGTLVIYYDGRKELRPHKREDFFTYVLPYEYDPEAECPLWMKFLGEALPDETLQQLLAEYCGYCFTSDIKCEKMLVLFGGGSNGKSVVLDVLSGLYGEPNVSNVSLSDATDDDLKRAMLEGKLVNISTESDKEMNASMLKALVSGEPVTIRHLYRNPSTMYRYAKFITSFNILPKAETTNGFYRRFSIIPFLNTVSDKDADVNLAKKLKKELSGILNWVLKGLDRFSANGNQLSFSEASQAALEKYKMMSDTARMFIHERCDRSEGYSIQGKELYQQYRTFCNEDGYKAVGKQKFFERAKGILPFTEVHNKLVFTNLSMKSEYEKVF